MTHRINVLPLPKAVAVVDIGVPGKNKCGIIDENLESAVGARVGGRTAAETGIGVNLSEVSDARRAEVVADDTVGADERVASSWRGAPQARRERDTGAHDGAGLSKVSDGPLWRARVRSVELQRARDDTVRAREKVNGEAAWTGCE